MLFAKGKYLKFKASFSALQILYEKKEKLQRNYDTTSHKSDIEKIQDLDSEIEDKKDDFYDLKQSAYWEIAINSRIICTTAINSHKMIPTEFWDRKSNYSKEAKGMCYRMILDEATQAKEPETLIPLLGAEQIVLIGDHK